MIRIFACGFTEKTGLRLYGRNFFVDDAGGYFGDAFFFTVKLYHFVGFS
jgi:hypothetical protein